MMLLVTSPTGKLGRAVLVTVAVREAIYSEPFVADQLVSPVYVIAGKHGATQETMSVITDEALGWKLGFGRLRRHGGDGRRVGGWGRRRRAGSCHLQESVGHVFSESFESSGHFFLGNSLIPLFFQLGRERHSGAICQVGGERILEVGPKGVVSVKYLLMDVLDSFIVGGEGVRLVHLLDQ